MKRTVELKLYTFMQLLHTHVFVKVFITLLHVLTSGAVFMLTL